MFIYRAGFTVGKGTYWNPETRQRQVISGPEGMLSGTGWYVRFPEGWLLLPVLPVGVALSMALPYGVGVLLFLLMAAAYVLMFETLSACEEVLGEPVRAIGRELFTWMTFGTVAAFDGTGKARRRKKDRKDN